MIYTVGNKNLLVDLTSNQITFLDSRFYLSETGNFWPSVTTKLESYPKGPQYYEYLKRVGEDADEILNEAGRKGSTVHKLCERYDAGELVSVFDENGFIQYKLSEWAMFERYVEFRDRFKPNIIYNELNIVSDALKTGGTLDKVVDLNGMKLLIDIKTGNAIYPHYWCQLAAYRKLFQVECNETVDAVGILWLNAKTRTDGRKDAIQGKGWQLLIEKDTDIYWDRFLACSLLWLAENENQQPKQLSYAIHHQLK